MKAPFPWFGGKSRIASQIWAAFGNVTNYVEPFAGSLAVLLSRPHVGRKVETVNDSDGLLVNFWRAVQADPEAVAHAADWPVSELDLTARHLRLVARRSALTARMEADPSVYDAQLAGWWVWGACAWIGGGWCSGEGPWAERDGRVVDLRESAEDHLGDRGRGINRQLPHLGNRGMGINRKLPHLGDRGMGINRKLPHLGDRGMGSNRQLPHLGNRGMGIFEAFSELSDRLRDVRICCGDWSRVVSDSVTTRHGETAVFLDPPYFDGAIDYAEGDRAVAYDVCAWAAANGERMKIALCGYEGDHEMPADWRVMKWKAHGGYSSADGENQNAQRERVWLSPRCDDTTNQRSLF
jgi:hypothetical protein